LTLRRAGALPSVQLNSRQPSSTEVPIRRIGLTVILAVSLALAPLTAGAQQGERVYRIGLLSEGAHPLSRPLADALRWLKVKQKGWTDPEDRWQRRIGTAPRHLT